MQPIFGEPIVQDIFNLISWLLRMLGFAGIGLAVGWLALDVLRKGQQTWQLQLAVFLGVVGLIIALFRFAFNVPSAQGLFGLGLVIALLLWGSPKKKEEEEKKEKK